MFVLDETFQISDKLNSGVGVFTAASEKGGDEERLREAWEGHCFGI